MTTIIEQKTKELRGMRAMPDRDAGACWKLDCEIETLKRHQLRH